MKSSGAVLNKLAAPNAPVGYVLVLTNLWLDAYTNTSQDRARARAHACGASAGARGADGTAAPQLKERFPKTSPQQLMCYMNVWCTLYYGLYMFGYSSALRRRSRGVRSRHVLRRARCAAQALGMRRSRFASRTPRRRGKCCCTAFAARRGRRVRAGCRLHQAMRR